MKKAVVLLSGGLDSATVLGIAKAAGYHTHCLSFDYGQRHKVELEMARQQVLLQNVEEHTIIQIDLRQFGGSALTDDVPVPKGTHGGESSSEIPITYVPARNTIFLAYGLAIAEVKGAETIFIGVNAVDYSGYPDCRPEFIEAFRNLAKLATKSGVSGQNVDIIAPLQNLSKAQVIATGLRIGVDYAATTSCYDPDFAAKPCQECASCAIRAAGFEAAGVRDPLFEKYGI
jgi:7-cyano-7-deazaguanine synthase